MPHNPQPTSPTSPTPGTPASGPAIMVSSDPTSRFETTGPLPDATGPAVTLPADLLAAISGDLEQRGVDVTHLRVVSAHRATWQDGAWGCPAPGKVYTQAIEEGYAVIVEAAGVRYDYRFGSGPVPKLCLPPGQR